MSALYTAVKVGETWQEFRRDLALDGVFDVLTNTLPLGEHRGHLRMVGGEEVGFRASLTDIDSDNGEVNGEVLVDDANEAKLAKAEAEVTRLRAALASIAALRPDEPPYPIGEESDAYGRFGGNMDDAFEGGERYGTALGHYEASSLAAKALGGAQ